MENHQTPEVQNLNSALMRHINRNAMVNYTGGTPHTPPSSLPFQTGLPAGHYGNSLSASRSTMNPDGATGFMPNPNNKLLKGQTMEDLLINLIKNTIAQNTWSDVGGQGTIQYFPLGHGPGRQPDAGRAGRSRRPACKRSAACRTWKSPSRCGSCRCPKRSSSASASTSTSTSARRTSRHEPDLLSGQFTPFGNGQPQPRASTASSPA